MRIILGLALVACTSTETKDTSTGPTGPTSTTATSGTTATTGDTGKKAEPFAGLTPEVWSFVGVSGMRCANGSDTGIGVNPGTDPEKLLVFVAGGGACWDAATCFGVKGGAGPTAVNIENDWGAAQMAAETGGLTRTNLTVLTALIPDWADATWLYVPYCTGDVHSGDAVQAYDKADPKRLVHHVGDGNWRAWVDYAQGELPDVAELWVNGTSAGGYGAQNQADRLVDAWPSAQIGVLADGAPMVNPADGRLTEWQTSWAMRMPKGCAACSTSMAAYLDHGLAHSKSLRLGLATSAEDAVIQAFFGYKTGPDLAAAVDGLGKAVYTPEARAWGFVAAGTRHVLVPVANTTSSRGGEPMADWYVDFMNNAKPLDAL